MNNTMNGEDKMLVEVAQTVVDEGFDWVLSQGYEWYEEWLVPCMRRINALTSNEKLLTDFWTEVGDFFDMMDTPRHSIEAYEKATKIDPIYMYPKQEYVDLLYQIGENEKAFQYNKAEVANDSEEAIRTHKENLKLGPSYSEEDRNWHAREYMVDGRYEDVLSLLEDEKGIKSCLLMAAAYSGMGEVDKTLACWKKLLRKKGRIELSKSDWFYISTKLHENPEFWSIVRELGSRLKGTFEQFTSLINTKGKVMQGTKMRDAIANFHLARLNNNIPELLTMYDVYPDWKELRDVISELQAPGEMSDKPGAS